MKTLQKIWDELPMKSDKGDIHSYIEMYEEILAPYRTTAKNILEIGLFNGASLIMWEKYFTGKAYGVDCDEQPHGGMADLRPMINSGAYNIFILNAEDEWHIKKAFGDTKFDVIVEDAGHDLGQQLKMYHVLSPYLSKGGIYIIEDIQDLDATREIFENIDSAKEVTILDRRNIKNRYDDVLVIIKDKP